MAEMTYQHLHIVFDYFCFIFTILLSCIWGRFAFVLFLSSHLFLVFVHYSVLFNCLTGLESAGSAIAHGGNYNAIVAGPLSCAANDRFHRWDICKFPFRDNLIQSQ